MRTTIDLDESLIRRLRDEAHAQGVSFRFAPCSIGSFSAAMTFGILLRKHHIACHRFRSAKCVRELISSRRYNG